MSQSNPEGLRKIRRALLSVSDKSGLVEFARALRSFDVELLSTGGTAKTLREAGIEVRDVADVTGFPEMLDGRIKTLHPRIHGGLLAVRDSDEHMAALAAHDIQPIDLVIIDLYPFEQTITRAGVTLAEAIEQIDIGGPAMIRSAAKNHQDVTVVVSPGEYAALIDEMKRNAGATCHDSRLSLALKAFKRTSAYDAAISFYLMHEVPEAAVTTDIHVDTMQSSDGRLSETVQSTAIEPEQSPPAHVGLRLSKTIDLRYGENPHQAAALYATGAHDDDGGIGLAGVLSGKEMSYNNYLDADAAWQLVCDFDETACAIIKHTNPAGVGAGASLEAAYRRALATDPVSAFGGIVAFNRTVDEAAARALIEIFTEVVIAPDFDAPALEVLRGKKNLRVLRVGAARRAGGLEYRQITGGMLVQARDTHCLTRDELKVVTRRAPTDEEIEALLFAWTVCKHTKSNAIVYAREGQTIGVGAGQMSRVDSVKLGAMRAQQPVAGSVLASDAFFPFRDGLDEAARHGITAVIQPGGSVRDEEVIAAADEHSLAMVFTGIRHFKH